MKAHLLAALCLALMVGLLALAANLVQRWSVTVPAPELAWAFVPSAVPDGAPFAAWYGFGPLSDADMTWWVQLRLCDEAGECMLGARKTVGATSGSGLVTATRNLAAGRYTVELLVVRRDRFGVPRTVQAVSEPVEYGE